MSFSKLFKLGNINFVSQSGILNSAMGMAMSIFSSVLVICYSIKLTNEQIYSRILYVLVIISGLTTLTAAWDLVCRWSKQSTPSKSFIPRQIWPWGLVGRWRSRICMKIQLFWGLNVVIFPLSHSTFWEVKFLSDEMESTFFPGFFFGSTNCPNW